MSQLLTGVTLAPDSSIFYHLHRPFFHDSGRLAEYPNDFASWADRNLGDAVRDANAAGLVLRGLKKLEYRHPPARGRERRQAGQGGVGANRRGNAPTKATQRAAAAGRRSPSV